MNIRKGGCGEVCRQVREAADGVRGVVAKEGVRGEAGAAKPAGELPGVREAVPAVHQRGPGLQGEAVINQRDQPGGGPDDLEAAFGGVEPADGQPAFGDDHRGEELPEGDGGVFPPVHPEGAPVGGGGEGPEGSGEFDAGAEEVLRELQVVPDPVHVPIPDAGGLHCGEPEDDPLTADNPADPGGDRHRVVPEELHRISGAELGDLADLLLVCVADLLEGGPPANHAAGRVHRGEVEAEDRGQPEHQDYPASAEDQPEAEPVVELQSATVPKEAGL